MTKWFSFFVFLWLPFAGIGQIKDRPPYQYGEQNLISSSDSILKHIILPEILIYPEPKDMSRKTFRQYTSLELKVKKVYPIAKTAALKLKGYNSVYLSFKKESERKAYVKKIEKDLFAEYETEIRTMTISEGRILIKLIDRETGQSSFEIIKEFKGGFSAFFWQSIARIFGHNLKSEYDAANEDSMIEYIVGQIDQGII
ncbi:MAG: DUF4294 domain-containing protein [Bacteroidia bacterium]|nr:DUF4294 domain-containing protein [Bacteroidia bacterium]